MRPWAEPRAPSSTGGPSWTRGADAGCGEARRSTAAAGVGDVIQRFERRGFKLVGMKMLCRYSGLSACG